MGTVDEDNIGIMLSKELPLRVCSIRSSVPSVEPSCAERTGRVHIGDLLTSVDGHDITHIPWGEVLPMVNRKKPVTLGFTVPHDSAKAPRNSPVMLDKESVHRDKQRRSRFITFGQSGKRSKAASKLQEPISLQTS